MVDLNKLTKLEALQQLAIKVRDGFATKDEMSAVDDKVTQLDTTVSGLESDVTELQEAGYQDEDDVKRITAQEINNWANQLTPEDEKVNTFKELVDYVAQHGSQVDGMLANILSNQQGIEKLQELIGELPKDDFEADDVIDYISKAIEKAIGEINLSEFVDTDDVNNAIDEKLENYYDKTYIDTTYAIATNVEVSEMLNGVFIAPEK